jgi:hypothetical protein
MRTERSEIRCVRRIRWCCFLSWSPDWAEEKLFILYPLFCLVRYRRSTFFLNDPVCRSLYEELPFGLTPVGVLSSFRAALKYPNRVCPGSYLFVARATDSTADFAWLIHL